MQFKNHEIVTFWRYLLTTSLFGVQELFFNNHRISYIYHGKEEFLAKHHVTYFVLRSSPEYRWDFSLKSLKWFMIFSFRTSIFPTFPLHYIDNWSSCFDHSVLRICQRDSKLLLKPFIIEILFSLFFEGSFQFLH